MKLTVMILFAAIAIACASTGQPPIDLSKLPPIVIGTPALEPKPKPEPAPLPVPKATVAFHVVDDATGAPIPVAIATFEDDTIVQANDDGYIAIEKELNTYEVKISADDYVTVKRNVVLTGNRQFTVRLTSTKPAPAPPKPEPPVVTRPPSQGDPWPPPVAANPLEEAAGWSDEQWRAFIMPLLKKTGDLVNEANLKVVRPELVARGADFQNGWRGDLRARVFLPVPGCASSAIKPDPLPCAYNRTFDLGAAGQPWDWIKR